ncbi:MAG: HPr family phosphocarrier protein [Anaerolineaceae bacterium]|jgi:phosphocarrier protein HPr|nr:HPr family phosphocarrier protein [Anaerolineaceae bacterium]
MVDAQFVVKNKVGLHARPANLLIKEAIKFKSNIRIKKGNTEVNAKSIISVLTLGAKMGDKIVVKADGPDELEALSSILELLERLKE